MESKTGAAAVSGQNHKQIRLPNEASILIAELQALKKALNLIINLPKQKYIIFIDCYQSPEI